MLQNTWNNKTIKQVKVINTNAKKYKVDKMITIGQTYDVKHETEEYYFIIDNSAKIGGFYKNYFEEVM